MQRRFEELMALQQRHNMLHQLLQQQHPNLRVLLPVAPGLMSAVQMHVDHSGLKHIRLLDGQSHAALGAADLVLVASGTATLEAALFKRPMVIAYKMPWLSWQITNRKRLQAWVGLPNILCQDFVVPELLQDAATPSALAGAVIDWLQAAETSPAKIRLVQDKFTALHVQLQRDTAQLATDAIEKILEG